MNNKKVIDKFRKLIGDRNVLTKEWNKLPYSKGWRYGQGSALAVVKPGKLIEMWKALELCVKNDIIIIMQAANTGLTGGSTPYGDGYDRPVVIINTMRMDDIHIINDYF